MAYRNLNKGSKVKMSRRIVIIPLHIRHDFMTDYVVQTSKILKKNNLVILFDFRLPYSWKDMLVNKGFVSFFRSIEAISKKRSGTVYFRPLSLLPFQSIGAICELNKKLGILFLDILLSFIKRKKIVWRFYPVLDFGIKPIKNAKYVYDCIDCLSEEKRTAPYFNEEKEIVGKMDVIAFNSPELMRIKGMHYPQIKEAVKIETVCGCDVNLFTGKRDGSLSRLIPKGRKMAILAGHIDYRIDFKLLEFLIMDNPSVIFMILGPVDGDCLNKFNRLFRFKNFKYAGIKRKSDLPSYFRAARVGIIPYLTKYDFVKYSNPMKAYEYMSAGTPVISTDIPPLRNLPGDMVFCSNDPKKLSAKLKKLALPDKKNFKGFAAVAKKYDWEHKVGTITNKIMSL